MTYMYFRKWHVPWKKTAEICFQINDIHLSDDALCTPMYISMHLYFCLFCALYAYDLQMHLECCTDLWNRSDSAEQPREQQHDFPSLIRVVQAQRVSYGKVAIQTDCHQNKRGEIESERSPEHHYPAWHVTGVPGHRHVPRDLHGHHDERHNHIRYRQVHDEQVDPGFPLPVPEQRDEHRQVADSGHKEQQGVRDHRDEVVIVEPHFLGQHLGRHSLWSFPSHAEVTVCLFQKRSHPDILGPARLRQIIL